MPEVERDLLGRGFSRRSFGRFAMVAGGAAALPFYNEPVLAQRGSGPREIPADAVFIMVCRGLLLTLHRAGRIALPPVTYVRHNPLAHRARPAAVLIETTPIAGRLSDLHPLSFQPVRRTADEPLFNSLMEEHHYLGYE